MVEKFKNDANFVIKLKIDLFIGEARLIIR